MRKVFEIRAGDIPKQTLSFFRLYAVRQFARMRKLSSSHSILCTVSIFVCSFLIDIKIPPVILDLFVSIPLYHTFFCPSNLGRWQRITKVNNDECMVEVVVNEEAFFCWAMQYGLHIEVLEPLSMRARIKDAVRELNDKYAD